MREILFRGKRTDNGEWIEGCFLDKNNIGIFYDDTEESDCSVHIFPVVSKTVGQYTGLTDKNGKKIFEGDIVQHLTYDDFDCQSVVKFGEYKQDGSGGEYGARNCLGFYVEVDNFTCPDWCENEPECFSDYQKQQNILEIANKCEVIGNIHDNPELLEG